MTEPPAVQWDGSLESLFAVLDEVCRTGTAPSRLDRVTPPDQAAFSAGTASPGGEDTQPELFAAPETQAAWGREADRGGLFFPVPEGSRPVFPALRRGPSAALLRELSANAFDAVVHAWMSELPIGAEIVRFALKVISAARKEAFRGGPPETKPPRPPNPPAESAETPGAAAGPGGPEDARAVPDAAQTPGWAALPEARRGAERAASGRGDPDTRAVLEAAYKTGRETDRLMGLLRFSPFPPGGGSIPGGPVYVARCSPDHYVLPGLADHFTRRFGECPWAVIDEKRNLVLARIPGGEARIFPRTPGQGPAPRGPAPDSGYPLDSWEDLWRNYYLSINNPDRNNPGLRRQFMPRRYWKYLPEIQ
jgi:probable DNA metabolism protein